MSYWTWLALMLGAISLALWGVAVGVGIYAWRKLSPMLLSMLGMSAAMGMVDAMMIDEPAGPRCGYRGLEGDRCELVEGHDGPHEWTLLAQGNSPSA